MTCPICGKKTVREYRPFCSKRCCDIDLGRWLKGGYAIPSNQPAGPGPEDDDS
ncbi:MAG: DNA gyrase inhibitor YacG [Jhaorihella sp.]